MRTKDWPMMSTSAIPAFLGIIYIIFVKFVGPNYMANKKPYTLRTTLAVYNSGQILACAYLTIEVIIFDIYNKIEVFGLK